SRHQGVGVNRSHRSRDPWPPAWRFRQCSWFPSARERRRATIRIACLSSRSRPMIPRLLVAALLLWPMAAQAQKAMQIVVPFAPGASADGIARIVASELAARLGRQVVVGNKPGAGGSPRLVAVAK